MILKYSKVRDGVFTPIRANPSDAGLDLRYSPDTSKLGDYDKLGNFIDIEGRLQISSGASVLIPTGIKLEIPHGYCFEIKNRSGNAAKKQLIVGACVVDSGYDGEVFINLHNVGSEDQHVMAWDKIAQVVLVPVVHFRALETNGDLYEWYPITISNRGDGALGSTDDKQ